MPHYKVTRIWYVQADDHHEAVANAAAGLHSDLHTQKLTTFQCHNCNKTSAHLTDLENYYCGNCKTFWGDRAGTLP